MLPLPVAVMAQVTLQVKKDLILFFCSKTVSKSFVSPHQVKFQLVCLSLLLMATRGGDVLLLMRRHNHIINRLDMTHSVSHTSCY